MTPRHVASLWALVICKRGSRRGDRHGHFTPLRSVVGEQGLEKIVLKKDKKVTGVNVKKWKKRKKIREMREV